MTENQLSSSLEENISLLKTLFKDDDTMVLRRIQGNNGELWYCIAYCDGVSSGATINDHIIKPLMLAKDIHSGENMMDDLMNKVLFVNSAKKTNEIEKIIESVTYGDTLLLADGYADVLILNSKGFQTRSVAEPDNEKIISGPREGFSETLMGNLSLIRRRIRTNELKMKFYSLGKQTKTQICICYLDNIVNKKILEELYKRLEKIDIDGILDSNYITELIRDSSFSCFRTTGYTERPDVVVGKLLEGRIAVFVDGTPVVMTIPYLFIENFQNGEDYYLNYYYTSFSRILRILAFFLTVSVPAIFISIVNFHHEMLPPSLMINIVNSREGVPLPLAMEALVMLIVFDLLRETGARMPSNVGHALSIVGALIIGQAAVEAKLVSAPMIIVVAITGVTGLIIPKMNAPILVVRFMMWFLASTMGFFGVAIGFALVLIHLLRLRSFGVSEMIYSKHLGFQDVKDIFIRAPLSRMFTRSDALTENITRMKK